jgi:hypothetical protein
MLLGCAEPPPPVVAPRPEPQEAPDVPTYCATSAKPCVPPQDFVEQLCKGRYPSVAVYLFQKHTPFVRLHAKSRTIELKNDRGGPTSVPVLFAEELLLVRVTPFTPDKPKKPPEEIYDVLRWDGTCATVPKRDVVTYLPGLPQATPVEFNDLDSTMRAALLRDTKLDKLRASRESACQAGANSDGCVQSSHALSEAIVGAVRQGLRVPMPRQRPTGAAASRAASSSAP